MGWICMLVGTAWRAAKVAAGLQTEVLRSI